jgi:hypothetical protein
MFRRNQAGKSCDALHGCIKAAMSEDVSVQIKVKPEIGLNARKIAKNLRKEKMKKWNNKKPATDCASRKHPSSTAVRPSQG